MSSTLRAALVLTLDDKLSSGLNRMKDELDKVKKVGRDITLGGLERGRETLRAVEQAAGELATEIGRIGRAADAAGHKLDRMASKARQKIAGAFTGGGAAPGMANAAHAVGGAIGVAAPIKEYGSYENILRHIAITKGLTGPKVEEEVGRLTRKFAEDALQTGQTSHSIAKAYSDLVQMGLKPEVADQTITAHSRAATAYNISAEALGPAVATLLDSFKIDEHELPLALGALAQAAKEGRFKVEDFSRNLPMIGGQMSLMNMTGRGNANTAFAALETVMKNSSEPGQAATNFYDALRYIFSPAGSHAFAMKGHKDQHTDYIRGLLRKGTGDPNVTGIDLDRLVIDAAKQGITPLDAVVGKLRQVTSKLTPEESSQLMGALLHNQQAGVAFMSLVQHKDDWLALRQKLGGISPAMVDADFDSARRAPHIETQIAGEGLIQIERRIGEGFAPLLAPLNHALELTIGTIEKLDEHHKGLADVVLTVTGGLVGLAAGLAALGFIAPAFAAGASLLGGAAPAVGVGLALLPPAAVGYSIWRDWNKPRVNPWDGSDTNINADPLSVPMMDDATAGRNRINIPLGLTNPAALGAAPLGTKTEILIRATPGTEIDSVRGDRGAVRILDPGLTMALP